MTHRKQAYDAACYYDGKLLGRCTVADSEAYSLLMKECGGEAVRVLREYPYLSPELKPFWKKRRSCRPTVRGQAACSMSRKAPRGARYKPATRYAPGCSS